LTFIVSFSWSFVCVHLHVYNMVAKFLPKQIKLQCDRQVVHRGHFAKTPKEIWKSTRSTPYAPTRIDTLQFTPRVFSMELPSPYPLKFCGRRRRRWGTMSGGRLDGWQRLGLRERAEREKTQQKQALGSVRDVRVGCGGCRLPCSTSHSARSPPWPTEPSLWATSVSLGGHLCGSDVAAHNSVQPSTRAPSHRGGL
jgi:hypothetical protein